LDQHIHITPLNEPEGFQPTEPLPLAGPTATHSVQGKPAHRFASQARTWSTRALLTTGSISFVCGALAWHIIGFWSFVSGIVFNPDGAPPLIGVPSTTEQIATEIGTAPVTTHKGDPAPAKATTATPARKAPDAVNGAHRPPASSETLAELLQCAEARKGEAGTSVYACPPLRRRLPHYAGGSRANRQLDAREAARRLAEGWQTGVATIETGSLQDHR